MGGGLGDVRWVGGMGGGGVDVRLPYRLCLAGNGLY